MQSILKIANSLVKFAKWQGGSPTGATLLQLAQVRDDRTETVAGLCRRTCRCHDVAIAAGGLCTDDFPELGLAEVGPWRSRSAINHRRHHHPLLAFNCYFRHKTRMLLRGMLRARSFDKEVNLEGKGHMIKIPLPVLITDRFTRPWTGKFVCSVPGSRKPCRNPMQSSGEGGAFLCQ